MNSPILELTSVGRRPPACREWLIRDVSLAIFAGQRWSITGPSGSGKTLVLRILAYLDEPEEGEVAWNGRTVLPHQVPEYRSRVQFLSQTPVLFAGTVADNLQRPFLLRTHRALDFSLIRAEACLRRLCRTADFLDKPASSLSGGERQIVAIIRALLLEPQVLLLDEPTSALDTRSRDDIERLIDQYLSESNGERATVWVSHDPEQRARMSDHSLALAKPVKDKEQSQ